jgi:predicted amidophosphoribosyltransferase
MTWFAAAATDLLLGGRCVGCGEPGRPLCRPCRTDLPDQARPVWPDPVPDGLAEPWACSAYDGVARELVLGLKERQLLGLVGPVAAMLAASIRGATPAGPVVLVPVPSRRATVRARGHDPTWAIMGHHLAGGPDPGRRGARRHRPGACSTCAPVSSTRPGSARASGQPTWRGR